MSQPIGSIKHTSKTVCLHAGVYGEFAFVINGNYILRQHGSLMIIKDPGVNDRCVLALVRFPCYVPAVYIYN